MAQIVKLKGDYTGRKHERQAQAKANNCDLVISFHFNSAATPNAAGAEVYYNAKNGAKVIAEELLKAIVNALNVPNRGVKSATGTRAAFLDNYHCPAVLLEPLFLSNKNEAKLMHDIPTVQRLARALAKATAFKFKRIGIDIGHKYKTSNPNDKGARCAFVEGCTEAFHAEILAETFVNELKAVESQPSGQKK